MTSDDRADSTGAASLFGVGGATGAAAAGGGGGASFSSSKPAPRLLPRSTKGTVRRLIGSAAPPQPGVAGYKSVDDRRTDTMRTNEELLRLRAEYEAACETAYELIHPSPSPQLQALYDLLRTTSQHAHAEDCGSRMVLGPTHFSDAWKPLLKRARHGERMVRLPADPPTAAELADGDTSGDDA